MNDRVDLYYKLAGMSKLECSIETLVQRGMLVQSSEKDLTEKYACQMVEGEAFPKDTSYNQLEGTSQIPKSRVPNDGANASELVQVSIESSEMKAAKIAKKIPLLESPKAKSFNVPCKSKFMKESEHDVTEELMDSSCYESEVSESEDTGVKREPEVIKVVEEPECMKVEEESECMKDEEESECMKDEEDPEFIKDEEDPECITDEEDLESNNAEQNADNAEKRFFCLTPKCRMSYTSEWRLLCHKQFHSNKRPLICAYPNCFKPYLSEGSFRIHQVKHEKGLIPDEPIAVEKKKRDTKNFHCPIEGCKASFARKWRLESHIAVHEGRKPYKCDFPGCDKQYSNLPHLKRHSHVHTPDEPLRVTTYPCTYPDCFQILKTKQNLEKHIKRKHTEKEFKCEFCSDSFSTKVLLDLHAYKFHDGPPHFQCGFCPGVGFTHQREYNRHLRKHKLHMCPIDGCFEMFEDYTILRKHVAAIHPPGFICYFCEKAIRNKSNFIRHIQQHMDAIDGVKPFRRQTKPVPTNCDICGLLLASKGSCERHKRKMHKLENAPVPATLKVPDKPRAGRSDAGIPKVAQASILSGIKLPPEVNLILIKNG